ncbi:PH domain leucine-rich repeat-containing protein phosphatase 1-like isoform X1 [Centruroides sculpturatus]|uniref:PH domain leucine-rich repeat-containing protein phosphatase 1-like isoform X1 n=2 Tax=Centruroides sculpturatus TaxID=218467 RepID=UPI000C6D0CC1|nr:PH domain leucine-rich repeat-containing protein phosphatase 1-like isoform X1 [Centruroides sculpturatus]
MAVEKSTLSDQIVVDARNNATTNRSKVTLAGHGMKFLPDNLHNDNPHLTTLDLRHNLLDLCSTDARCITLNDFSRFEYLAYLNIADNKLGQLPQSIGRLTKLEELNIVGNGLTVLPPEIGKLERLTRLYADFNQLSTVPTEMELLNKLTVLSLSHNNFIMLPSTLQKIKTLEVLVLSGNCLTCLLQKPAGLTYLDVRANNLQGIIEVNDLQMLQHLDISYNCVQKLEIASLSQLRFIDSSYNQLNSLTLHGESLQILVASNNRLKKLEIVSSVNKLEILDVSFNQLTYIPEIVCDAPQLVILDVSHNRLPNIPNRLFNSDQSQLQIVKLNHNLLNFLPEITTNFACRCIHLQHNLLSCLPLNLFICAIRLEELNVAHNRLLNLPLPYHPIQLKKLYLSSNLLNEDIFQLVSKCPKLQVLHLAYNGLQEIPESIFQNLSNLREFSMAANQLDQFPAGLITLPLLQILCLHSNKLTNVPQLSKYPSLKAIDLACNNLSKVSLMSIISPHLSYLDLSCNSQLQINPTEFHSLCSDRSVGIVNVDSKRRNAVPFTNETNNINNEDEDPWVLGFTETYSGTARLSISMDKKKQELSIVVIESNDREQVSLVKSFLPQLLKAEKSRTEGAIHYMCNTILAALRLIKTKWPHSDPSLTLYCLTPSPDDDDGCFVLRLVSAGQPAGCVLIDNGEAIAITENNMEDVPSVNQDWETALKAGFTTSNKSALSTEHLQPKRKTCFISEPQMKEIRLKNTESHLVIGSSALWEALEVQEILQIVDRNEQIVQSSKHLSELSMAIGNREGVCIAVLALQLDKANLFSNSSSNNSSDDNNQNINLLSSFPNISNWHNEDEDKIQNDELIEDAEKYKSWEYMLEQNHKMLFSRELETIHRSLAYRNTPIQNEDSSNWCSNNTSIHPHNFRGRYYCYGYYDKSKFPF